MKPLEHDPNLIACPQCDALHHLAAVPEGATARCHRCHYVLVAPRERSAVQIVSLALASLILLIIAVTFPFLSISAGDLSSNASVLDAVAAFAAQSGMMLPLSVMIALLIILLPAARLIALIYALAPLISGRAILPHAAVFFRFSMRLRPWAMAEIFMIGVAVALVKIAGLAQVEFGPAFWAFAGVVVLIAATDTLICERSLWNRLKPPTMS